MLRQQEIDKLQRQLVELRREFTHYLEQRAAFGKMELPYESAKRIDELREQIRQVKQSLLALGVSVDDGG